MADLTIPAYAHGGRFKVDPPAFHVIHSTEGPMSRGNAKALAEWFARPPANGGPGTSATDIFDPVDAVTMLDEHTIPFHVGPVGNGLSTGSEHCGSVNLTPAQWMSPDGQAMLDRSAKRQAQRAVDRAWSLADCRWLTLTEVARRTVRGFCTHNDVRLALGGTTHSDPGKNFPYAWFMDRIRYWFQVLTGTVPQEEDMAADPQVLAALNAITQAVNTTNKKLDDLYRVGFASKAAGGADDPTHYFASVRGTNQLLGQVVTLLSTARPPADPTDPAPPAQPTPDPTSPGA